MGERAGFRSPLQLPQHHLPPPAMALGSAGYNSAGQGWIWKLSCLCVVSDVCAFALIVNPRGFSGISSCHLPPGSISASREAPTSVAQEPLHPGMVGPEEGSRVS